MREPYASGIHRHPPEPVSKTLPDVPTPVVYENGRIGWPGVLQYRCIDGDSVSIENYPPTEKAEREPSKPSPVPKAAQPRTVPYQIIVYDQPVYEALKASGLLADPRHTGGAHQEPIDNRTAPGA